MAKNNGTLWKIISIAVTLLVLAGGAIYGYATLEHQVEDNSKMQPDVKLNTEHRIKFEEKVNTMADSIEAIRAKVVEK